MRYRHAGRPTQSRIWLRSLARDFGARLRRRATASICVGMFTRHRLGQTNKLDCPHAIGTNAFSSQRPEPFRHFLLLPSPHSTPSLRSVGQGRLYLFTTDRSRQTFESALERVRRRFTLQIYGYVAMPEHVHLLLSEPQQDTSSGRTALLKPKPGLNGPPTHFGLLSELRGCSLRPLRLKAFDFFLTKPRKTLNRKVR
jgi:hypothetical protein